MLTIGHRLAGSSLGEGEIHFQIILAMLKDVTELLQGCLDVSYGIGSHSGPAAFVNQPLLLDRPDSSKPVGGGTAHHHDGDENAQAALASSTHSHDAHVIFSS